MTRQLTLVARLDLEQPARAIGVAVETFVVDARLLEPT
mgnify:CR=1 FL=1